MNAGELSRGARILAWICWLMALGYFLLPVLLAFFAYFLTWLGLSVGLGLTHLHGPGPSPREMDAAYSAIHGVTLVVALVGALLYWLLGATLVVCGRRLREANRRIDLWLRIVVLVYAMPPLVLWVFEIPLGWRAVLTLPLLMLGAALEYTDRQRRVLISPRN